MKDWVLDVWGDHACFTRPEMKVERMSYNVITPSAARGIYEAIFWKPAIVWHITKIEILNPIKWGSVRRNELSIITKLPSKNQMSNTFDEALGIAIEDNRQQRATLLLKDVRYRLHAYFDFIAPEMRVENQVSPDENPAKYAAMFERRAKKGQCFHRPYLGCREFPCYFILADESSLQIQQPILEDADFGWMLYDLDYSNPENISPEFFHATMQQGVINTDRRDVEVRK